MLAFITERGRLFMSLLLILVTTLEGIHSSSLQMRMLRPKVIYLGKWPKQVLPSSQPHTCFPLYQVPLLSSGASPLPLHLLSF